METKKTHWKQLINVEYIGAYSLENGADKAITIEKVVRELVKGTGGKKEECTVAYLRGEKPFIVNRTNAKMITKLVGSPYIEDWAGRTVTVYATTTQVAGDTVECLRVRPELPKAPDYGKYELQLRSCTTLDELKAVFTSPGFPQLALTKLKDELKDELSKN